MVGVVDPNSLRVYANAFCSVLFCRDGRRDCPEAHSSTRDCGRTKACKHLTNDYIKKRVEWICENLLKVFDCEMDFMYRCGVEC
jgi:hypothetical protein